VLQRKLEAAYERLDQELKTVARIQRSLLPEKLPGIPTLDLAAYYETSARAGGDYYDVFNLGDGRWGIFMADVCGHGTPAAVLMAITHSLAHGFHFRAGHPDAATIEHQCPAKFMAYLNANLEARYAGPNGTFVTAFFGIFNERTRQLTYANAGHPPPRVKRCSDGSTFVLDGTREISTGITQHASDLPLGIMAETQYNAATAQLEAGDQVVIYTDGITEARDPCGDLFGTDRLDRSIEHCGIDAGGLITTIMTEVEAFTNRQPADDDRTILVGKVR
jgi:sigma-B regulation protein RsbU (phosphoserine phosphatase)